MPRILIYTKPDCPFCDQAKALLQEKGVSWEELDIEAEPARREEMIQRGGRQTVPQIWIGDRHVGGADDLFALEHAGELDALLGRQPAPHTASGHTALCIIGSGPAGYTAGIYAARAELEPVLVAGMAYGGQLMLTTDVENYPGFPDGISGPELMERMQKQCERFGARVIKHDATRVDLDVHPFRIETDEERFTADALIIATGASARWLGLPSEKRLMNRGVSACATCDGALFRGKAMAVVGGGDTALEEALFLTRFASIVYLVHRRDRLRASRIMQERALRNEKIELIWDSVVEEVLGGEEVTGVRLQNVKTGATRDLEVGALFVAIGHEPSSALFGDALRKNAAGYILVEPGSTRTNVEGVFACGDVMDPSYRQAVTAAGTGCMAALDAERWLAARA
ncbi:MAG: thioredoxin-disulfide reductase [Myxococcota bacterium]